jgi:type I protein arginine methyltransferase
MINFIRHKKITSPSQLYSTDTKQPLWLDDEFLKPINGEFETWLSYDFDQLNITENSSDSEKLIEELKAQLAMKDQILQQAFEDKEKMREAYTRLLNSSTAPETPSTSKRNENGVASKSLEFDNDYFESYAHFSIHHTMLSDKVRTDSYRDAILMNPNFFKDKLVMDVGCGTSILSMFASKAGAKTVYAIDQSDVIYKAMDIATTNGFKNIKFVKGRLEDIETPFEKVDIIISEWMGYFLLFEGMLDSVIYARKNYLKEGGLLLPNRCTISIVGYGDDDRYKETIEFFKNVYGFNMSCMLKDILLEGHVEVCKSEFIMTKSNEILNLDLMTCDLDYSNFSYDFNLEVTKAGKMNSIVGYFDCFFELPEKQISFSTSPDSTPTHWKQVIFYFDEPIEVKVGENIKGKLINRRDRKDLRAINVEIEIFGKTFKYLID